MAFENGKQLIRKRLLQKNNCCCGIFKKYGPKDFYKSPSLILLEQSWEKGTPSQKIIDVGKVKYEKKALVIYNPNSGRRLNVRVQISKELDKQGIPYEFYETKGYLDALNHVMNFEIENYSAIAAVGGDGTIHEIINGLLKRPDGNKIPIALLPNGSGNDACGGIKVDTME